MVIKLKRKTYCLIFHSNVENFKQFSKENAAKLFENFKIKNKTTDKYSLIYVLYYTEIISSLFIFYLSMNNNIYFFDAHVSFY